MVATHVLAVATPPADAAPVGFLAVLALFVAMWLAVSTLLAALSGHVELLRRFPPVAEREEETFRFASGRMRWVSFSSALHVGVGPRGLHLAANALFRAPFHRGIPCIP